jgi:hypothetical protein
MTKRRTAVFTVVGLAALLVLTACAGVASVQSDSRTGAPTVFGASVDTLTLPVLDLSVFRAENNSLLRSASLAEKLVEQATQMQQQFSGPGGCDHMNQSSYDGSDL